MEENTAKNPESPSKIVFKKRKRIGNLKTQTLESVLNEEKIGDNDNENCSIDWSTLDELRELRKAKKRITRGIGVLDLLKQNTNDKNEEKSGDKIIGGLTDSKTLANELDLGNTFSLETNRRDEDAELMRYVEEELAKRRSNSSKDNCDGNQSSSNNADSTRDLLVKSIPDHLLQLINESKSKNEEMLSSQMLSGIPEIDLGIEERIRNIEKTEAARTKLIENRIQHEYEKLNNQKDLSFVPKNLASCFNNRNLLNSNSSAPISNHRFNLNSISTENKDLISHFIDKEEKRASGSRNNDKQQTIQQYDIEPVVVIGDEPQKVKMLKPIDKDKRIPGKDKPTDNYMFEKFKKQLKKR